MSKSGFTLIEVLVALLVLVAGVLAFGCYLDLFKNLRTNERASAKAFFESVQVIEFFIKNPPQCVDSVFNYDNVNVSVKNVPGEAHIAWVYVNSNLKNQIKLRRLVRCKK